jgi:hypothetical protein
MLHHRIYTLISKVWIIQNTNNNTNNNKMEEFFKNTTILFLYKLQVAQSYNKICLCWTFEMYLLSTK